jgi:hypothetical protein
MNYLEAIENMPVTYTKEFGWELHDFITGEIFAVESRDIGIALRNTAFRSNLPVYEIYAVRVLQSYFPYGCNCCGIKLNDDELNFCRFCINEGCNA